MKKTIIPFDYLHLTFEFFNMLVVVMERGTDGILEQQNDNSFYLLFSGGTSTREIIC